MKKSVATILDKAISKTTDGKYEIGIEWINNAWYVKVTAKESARIYGPDRKHCLMIRKIGEIASKNSWYEIMDRIVSSGSSVWLYTGTYYEDTVDERIRQMANEMIKDEGYEPVEMNENLRLFLNITGTIAIPMFITHPTERYERYFYSSQAVERYMLEGILLFKQHHPETELFSYSCLPENAEYAHMERNEWLDKHFCIPQRNRIFFTKESTDRANLIPDGKGSYDVLIDDNYENLEEFLRTEDAKGILVHNEYMEPDERWDGGILCTTDPAKVIAKKLEQILITYGIAEEKNNIG